MRRGNLWLGAVVASAFLFGLGGAVAAYQVAPVGGAGAPGASAAPIFQARCASCHDPAVDRAPSKDDFKQRAPADIVRVLTTGSMAPMAAGLTPVEVQNLAQYVTGKVLAQVGTGGAVGGRLGGVPQPPDNMCATHPTIRTTASDWNGYGSGDLKNSRYQRRSGIAAKDVGRLKVKWAFSYAGGRYGQPTVVGDHLFVSSAANHVYSLDARTGCVHWRVDLNSPRTSPIVERRPGLSPSGWVVYVGDNARDVFALDAMTGKQLWKVNVDPHDRAVLTGSPILYEDSLYVPVSSLEEMTGGTASYGCCTFSGKVVAVDVKTGKIRWSTSMIEPARPTRRNASGTQMFGPAGAAIWSQPTIDVKRKQLYVATGDSYTEIDAPRSDAVVAIDLASGKIKWHNQVTKNDNFVVGCSPTRPGVNCPAGVLGPDYDFGASPIIADLPGGRQMILAGQKSGIAYGMDPDTGVTIWLNKVGAGSALGGIEWGMAADEKTLYAGVADIGVPADRAKQGINAIDIATGKLVWTKPAPNLPCSYVTNRCSHGQSAAPVVIPGVVFSGGQDGWIRGYSTTDGKILWEFEAVAHTYDTVNGVKGQPGGGFDGAGPIIAGDSLYVIAGFSGASGVANNPLNVLLAFSVDGK